MTDKIERRKHLRHKVKWPVTVFTDQGKVEGETSNISVNGIYICCKKPLPIDKEYRILVMPPGHHVIEVTGNVVWSDLYGLDTDGTVVGMGICFVKISDEDRHFFYDLIFVHLGQKG